MNASETQIKTDFSQLASEDQIKRTMAALESSNIQVFLAENGAEAKKKLFDLLPENAEVFISSSTTMIQLGVPEVVNDSGRYNSVRVRLATMDPKTQGREMQKLGATPEFILGSVHAVTEDGHMIIASQSGSQLSGYAAAAAHVIWIVGTQKIVADLATGMKRVEEYSLPLESARAMKVYGVPSSINKLLIVYREAKPGRTSMILVKENLGF